MVTVAPVAVVTADGLLNMTPFVAARSIAAPVTEAFPLVSAKTVNVTKEVPSAFNTVALELILIAVTFAFVTVGVGVVVGEQPGIRLADRRRIRGNLGGAVNRLRYQAR